MKKIYVYILLIFFSFSGQTSADDITDFQIEGLSVGDSVFDYFTSETLNKTSRDISANYSYDYYNGSASAKESEEMRITAKKKKEKPMKLMESSVSDDKFDTYDTVQVTYLADTNIIKSVTGVKYFENKYEICKTEKKEAVNEISNIIEGKFKLDRKDEISVSFGKISVVNFIFDSGDSIVVACYDYDKKITNEHGWVDSLLVTIHSKGLEKVKKDDSTIPVTKSSSDDGKYVTIKPYGYLIFSI